MPLSTPPSHLSHLSSLPSRFTSAWSSTSPASFVSLFTPNGTYTDHAFQIIRSGQSILERHFNIWRTANPDFIMIIDDSRPVHWSEGNVDGEDVVYVSFRTINRGTFEKDLPNTKASGKRFWFIGVIDLEVERESGLVRRLDEWYTNNRFDSKSDGQHGKGGGLEEYNVMSTVGSEH